MILVDTSIWVDHLRSEHRVLQQLLERGAVLSHPWVTGELALGHLSPRREILRLLDGLPSASVGTAVEMLMFVERHELMGSRIGYVDVQLLTATLLTPDARLWTGDKRQAASAAGLGIAFDPAAPDEP